jgi:hypothetical protein
MSAAHDAVFSQWEPVLERLADGKSLARRDVKIIQVGEGSFVVQQDGPLLMISSPTPPTPGSCFLVITGGKVVAALAARNEHQTDVLLRASLTVAAAYAGRQIGLPVGLED